MGMGMVAASGLSCSTKSFVAKVERRTGNLLGGQVTRESAQDPEDDLTRTLEVSMRYLDKS